MKVELTKLPESRVALKIEMTPEEVDQARERTYRTLVQRVNIPGFRRGKAPRPVVERLVGAEYFEHEATDEAVRWGYRKAIEAEKITPIDEADIAPGEGGAEHIEDGQPFQFEATVAVKPEVQLPEYHSLRLEREPVEVSDEEIDAVLAELRNRNATLEPTIRAAQLGDTVTINIMGRAGGEEVLNQENLDFELLDEETEGPNLQLPGLAAELAGSNRGDIKEIVLPLPDTYADPELAGKSLSLRVLIKEIKRKVLPELDDEFAETVSKFATLAELRDALRENLAAEKKLEADQKLVSDAVEAVTSRTFLDIPPVLVEEELDRMVGDMADNFQRAQLDFDMYLQSARRSIEDVRAEMREAATANVKTSLVIAALADAEGVEVSNSDVDDSLDELVRGAGIEAAERRRLRANKTVRANLRTRLRRRLAVQRLVEIVSGEDISAEAADPIADNTAGITDDEADIAVEVAG